MGIPLVMFMTFSQLCAGSCIHWRSSRVMGIKDGASCHQIFSDQATPRMCKQKWYWHTLSPGQVDGVRNLHAADARWKIDWQMHSCHCYEYSGDFANLTWVTLCMHLAWRSRPSVSRLLTNKLCAESSLKNFAQLIHFRLSRKQRPACVQLGKDAGTAPNVDSRTVLVLQQDLRCTVI